MKIALSSLTALLSLTAAISLQATTVIPPTFAQLVDRAQLIVEGTVTDVSSHWVGEGGQRHIISYVTVRVEDTLKGSAGGATYTLRMLGGTVGDTKMGVSDAPEFQVGDRDILFIENNGNQFIPLVGIMHGRFRVGNDAARGGDVVLDNLGHAVAAADLAKLGTNLDAALGGHTHAHVHTHGADEHADTANAMPLSAFKAAIRDQLNAAQ